MNFLIFIIILVLLFGAINALGYATEEDNMIKVVDNKLSNELLEVLLTS
jgi:hypothetical protein